MVKPVLSPVVEPTYPAGAREGYYPDPTFAPCGNDPRIVSG